MANVNDIVARLVLNAKGFTAGFDAAVTEATNKARAGGAQISRAFNDTAGDGLRNFAGQVPLVGSALTGLSGVALATAAGIGAVTVAAGAAVAGAEEYAQAARQLEAVLKATGNQTGFTTEQLKEFAEAQESAFAISAESILKAEQVLASFDGVAGTTFKRAITAAADLAAVYGGDLTSNSEKLGVVLQNLAQGNVEGLSRGFKFLGTTTLETIEALALAGRTAEAQTALLDALEQKIGGSGAASAQGVAGAFFRLKDAIGDASRAFAEQSGLYDAAVSGLNAAADAAGAYADKLKELDSFEFTGEIFKRTSPIYLLYDKLFGSGQVAGINVSPGNSAAFGGFGGRSNNAAEDAAAKAAADRAKAEGDRARATEQAATAATKHATASEAAAKSIERQQKALNEQIADLEFQAKAAGMSRTEAEKLGTLRRLEIQYGKLLSDNDRQRIANAIELRQRTEEQVAARRAEIDDFVSSNGSLLPGLMDGPLKPKDIGDLLGLPSSRGSAGATEVGQQFRYLSDAFYDVFSNRAGNLWDKFKDLGARTLSELASQFILSGKIDIAGLIGGGGVGGAGGLGSLFGGAGGAIGGGLTGFAIGNTLSGIGGNRTGGAIGSGIGSIAGTLAFGPLGGIIGGALGGAIGGAIGPTSRGFANLRTDASGRVVQNNMQRGSDGTAALDSAAGAAQAFLSSLNGIASQFGGSLAGNVDLGAIGFSKGTFQLKSTQLDRGAYGGGTTTRFNTAEEVVAAALQQALSRGAVTGIDASIQRLLSTGDLATQTAKASLLSNALKEFNTASDPTRAAIDQLNEQFSELRDVMTEAGSSAEDLAKASALYDRKLQEIQRSSEQAVSGLRSFLADLNFGGGSPLSLGDQRAAALANYNSQVGLIGSANFDQGAFVSAGQRLLDIETQISGRTQDFFSIFNQVQADTNRAISTITNATGITGDNPFARQTADATAATANNTSLLLQAVNNLNATLTGGAAAGGGAFVGGTGNNRGFVASGGSFSNVRQQ